MNSKARTAGIVAGTVSFLGLVGGATAWGIKRDDKLVAESNQNGRLEMRNPNAAIGITPTDMDSAEIFATLVGNFQAPNIGCVARIRRNGAELVFVDPSDMIDCSRIVPAMKLTVAQINAEKTR